METERFRKVDEIPASLEDRLEGVEKSITSIWDNVNGLIEHSIAMKFIEIKNAVRTLEASVRGLQQESDLLNDGILLRLEAHLSLLKDKIEDLKSILKSTSAKEVLDDRFNTADLCLNALCSVVNELKGKRGTGSALGDNSVYAIDKSVDILRKEFKKLQLEYKQ